MTIIGFESGTRFVPPPPSTAWRIGFDGEQTYTLTEPPTVPGIEGTDYHGEPCPVALRGGYPQADCDGR